MLPRKLVERSGEERREGRDSLTVVDEVERGTGCVDHQVPESQKAAPTNYTQHPTHTSRQGRKEAQRMQQNTIT